MWPLTPAGSLSSVHYSWCKIITSYFLLRFYFCYDWIHILGIIRFQPSSASGTACLCVCACECVCVGGGGLVFICRWWRTCGSSSGNVTHTTWVISSSHTCMFICVLESICGTRKRADASAQCIHTHMHIMSHSLLSVVVIWSVCVCVCVCVVSLPAQKSQSPVLITSHVKQ